MKRLKRNETRLVQRSQNRWVNLRSCGCLWVLFWVWVNPSIAYEVVGKVTVLKGMVTARVGAQPECLLTSGSGVYLQDQLKTYDDSFVVIKMHDNSKLTLSPGRVLLVQAYVNRSVQRAHDSSLLKDKLRELSGLIGQSKPAATNEKHTATIGIRGPIARLRECVDRDFPVNTSNGTQ